MIRYVSNLEGTATMIIQTVDTIAALRKAVNGWRREGQTVALVPTMGALHEAHFSLVKRAQKLADRVVVSIFVNPTQFGPNEDYDQYPRLVDADVARLDAVGADLAFTPTSGEMYPENFRTIIEVTGLNEGLCADYRPGHFDAVAVVVMKLFMQCLPDIAVFGEKDYQQLQVIRKMVQDLDVPVRIESAPTLREKDGLALSSRNRYLNEKERAIAPALYKTLEQAAKELPTARNIRTVLDQARQTVLDAGFRNVEYLSLCDADDLTVLKAYQKPARLIVAAYLGKTRLIDNIEA
jgi:pantoate--beta-alanine ligase